ncbi:MAG: hypothetical protein A2087_03640 [Spirochaetes bacterium GWD1_61_31]|nr:MAG: hypothetical protein A2Y37_01015 [Spirochaetes bacterium GWB1_60_80]OHD30984.1 MAG: hypothetical protein A2004_06815 [Spirochaetes bacterium GWC1_61_12]OHD36184.1 MAG: hypothetical protein A2087_03640 [Spirochaetes bacterium GWD1_61_31]OHD43248.1 MAG: hypothetical protein A2Y35_08460 [Spirochaetes bacterium GWE1_60_18]OHD58808.1 MAG: hypothetical protein A2Y32_01295 [Spirochaetes bacterium GWF1_60_12]HAP43330.1 hypothetical protein [Spirochaetaceae bacterium]
MISFPGHEDAIAQVYRHGQGHLFDHWSQLNEAARRRLLADLSTVDYAQCAAQFAAATAPGPTTAPTFDAADYLKRPEHGGDIAHWEAARAAGLAHIRAGRLAAFVVAGGQGSRLGFDGPKGAFKVSPVRGKSLFQLHSEKIRRYGQKYGVSIPFFVMTSTANHADTEAHFRQHDWFGLDPAAVSLFPQAMIPTLDTRGHLILAGPDSLFRNPDGHGGSLSALKQSGATTAMQARGIETISYFQVDNPTVNLIDPVFVGFHQLAKAEVSSKVLVKTGSDEKVGNLVRFADGRTGVVEYSDLNPELARQTLPDGSLRFQAGSIGIHLFERQFVDRLGGSSDFGLPFHVARKKIKAWRAKGLTEIEAFKFEKFVFDALPLTERSVALEACREDEFAPVKNQEGVDSLDSSQALMMKLHRRWLAERGITVPATVRRLEISPLLAVEAADLPAGLTVPAQADVYLE